MKVHPSLIVVLVALAVVIGPTGAGVGYVVARKAGQEEVASAKAAAETREAALLGEAERAIAVHKIAAEKLQADVTEKGRRIESLDGHIQSLTGQLQAATTRPAKRGGIEGLPLPMPAKIDMESVCFGTARVGIRGSFGYKDQPRLHAYIHEIIDEETAIINVSHGVGRSKDFKFIAQKYDTRNLVDNATVERPAWTVVGKAKYQGETLWVIEPVK